MRDLADLLEEHREAHFPTEIEKGRDFGLIDPVMIDADIFGWVSSYASGVQLNTDAHRGLEKARLELGESWKALPVAGLPYFARLLRMAVAAVQGCEAVPSPAPPSADGIDLLARVACNGEVMWARSHADQALCALTDAGFEILGLDMRKYAPGGGTYEAPWSSLEPEDDTTNLDQALRSLEAALDSEFDRLPLGPHHVSQHQAARVGSSGERFDRWRVRVSRRGTRRRRLVRHGADSSRAQREPVRSERAAERCSDRRSLPQLRAADQPWPHPARPAAVHRRRTARPSPPAEHVEEPLREVRIRAEEACRTASDWGDWAFSCWTVNTGAGNALASEHMGRRR